VTEYLSRPSWAILVFGVFLVLSAQTQDIRANTFTVNSTADMIDASPGDGKCETGRDVPGITPAVKECSLRAAIQESNALAGKHQINLPSGSYLLSRPTLCSYRLDDIGGAFTETSISLCMTGQMSIIGAGASSTIIDANSLNRVIFLDIRAVVEMSGVTVRKGNLTGTQAFVFGGGGGIHNRGKLKLSETVISENTSNFGGGGIHNVGTLTIDKSTIIANTTVMNSGLGGGVYSQFGGLTITDCLVTGNGSLAGGGITIFTGTAKVTGTTVSDNSSSGSGGGIFSVSANLILTNSTLSNNTGFNGGGLSVDQQGAVPTTTLNNVTITHNKGMQTGGGLRTTVNITVKNTLIGGNTNQDNTTNIASPDCETFFSSIQSQGFNLIQNPRLCTVTGDTTGNQTGKDPLLGSLTNNGGSTPTHALLPGSPALNAGSPEAPGSGGASACATADQRALLRPMGQRCDIGAVENNVGFTVTGALPNRGGNAGSLITSISGSGFVEGVEVRLKRTGQADIIGSPTAIDEAGFALSTSFDFNGKATGAWDVVVTNPGGPPTTLVNGFTIEQARAPQLWSEIVGRSAIRAGTPAEYAVFFGNRGNVDAADVPLTISIPANFKIAIYFNIAPPPTQSGQVPTDWSRVPVAVLPATERTNILLLLPVVPAGFTGQVRFRLLIPPLAQHGDSFLLSAFLGDPYFQPALDNNVVDGLVAGARAYALQNLGVTIPASLDAELKQYATQQLLSIVTSGRQFLVDSLSTQTEVYSLGQLTFDLAQFGAARANAGPISNFLQWTSAKILSATSSLVAPLQSGTTGKKKGCQGGTLLPGKSCNDDPGPLPGQPPDPQASPTPFEFPTPPPPITPGECKQIPKHHISSDGSSCLPDNRKDCGAIPVFGVVTGGSSDCTIVPIKNSVDPNDKTGSIGVAGPRFRQSQLPLNYTVFFENLPTATAAAQTVTITDQLDTANLDLDTFSLGPVQFGSYAMTPPPGQSNFVGALDLRPAMDLLVKIDARLDKVTGIITWKFTSLDPTTQELTEDPIAGFLPPNTNPPAGEGKVRFSIQPKKALSNGATTCNKAKIVFDVNAPIETPLWCNSFDDQQPTSQVQALAPAVTTTNFVVHWSGNDAASGISDYTIYVSDNGGPFTPWLTQTSLTEAAYSGVLGHSYSFFSVARDLTENIESVKSAPEATTFVTTTACQNPIDCSEFFVRQHYLDFLAREPDSAGLQFWTNEIELCGADTSCREVKRINVSAAFFLSTEFQKTGFLAYRTRKSAFGNISGKPVPITRAELSQDVQVLGNGVIVGALNWEQKLEQNTQTYFDQVTSAGSFNTLYPQSMTAAQYVDALNQNAGGVLSATERDALVVELTSGAKTRAQALRRVAEDSDLVTAEFNKAFVLIQYFGYLRRDPDSAPDTNFTGWQFWLTKLDQFHGNFVDAEMVKAFIISAEYRTRFGP